MTASGEPQPECDADNFLLVPFQLNEAHLRDSTVCKFVEQPLMGASLQQVGTALGYEPRAGV